MKMIYFGQYQKVYSEKIKIGQKNQIFEV